MPYIYKTGKEYGVADITITGKNCVEMTQARYDALTLAEKNNGTIYFITDSIPDTIIVNDPAPIGSIQAYGGSSAPSGWLLCDGSAVSRSLYSELFTVIGTLFGSGDGITTFNLPDLQGRVITGAGTIDSITYSLGDEVDAGLPNIEGQALLQPSAAGNNTVVSASGAIRTAGETIFSDGVSGALEISGSGITNAYRSPINFSASNSNSIYGNSTTVQPNTVVTNYIIKAQDQSFSDTSLLSMVNYFYPVGSYYETSDTTFDPNIAFGGTWVLETEGQVHVSAGQNYIAGDTGGEATHTLIVNEMPSHTHTMLYAGGSAVNWGYNYASSGGTRSAQTEASGGVGPTGGGQAHNNMQPYIVVNRWHRTA